MDKRVYMKVKSMSLAEEAKIIRREERRAKIDELRDGLTDHRKRVVRPEARATLITYAFMRGKPYNSVEHNVKNPPSWDRVRSMVYKYCDYDQRPIFEEWVKEAKRV